MAAPADEVDIQILGINDFHGRIAEDGKEAGAAVLAGAVKKLRDDYMVGNEDHTVFAAAGDLIGASTFASFIAEDKPTIDALNEAGLEVSAVGNHEFDQGYDDLINRVMKPFDASTNPYGGAEWEYLGANVRMTADNSDAVEPSWIKEIDGVKVGFIGAVTDHLDELVSPAGIADLTIEAPVVAANREAIKLKADGAKIIILLVHEGASSTDISTAIDPNSDFGKIVTGVNENVDAIISGHTHLAYNHNIPVQKWADDGRVVTERPVVSAGQYGYNLNQIKYTFDTAAGELTSMSSEILPLMKEIDDPAKPGKTKWVLGDYTPDANTEIIVTAAEANAAVLGAEPLGDIDGPFKRAMLSDGATENRGGESTLGNLVAEAQRWATESATTGSAEIAFMNPGGLRKDMLGIGPDYPTTLTYQQAAEVQPFANTLINMNLTGTQIKTALEQQWQPDGSSRPFLNLGISEGFNYVFDSAAATGEHITGMWLDHTPIEADAIYSVTVNSFLASGGDNFGVFAEGADARDTGQTDLQGMVDFMATKSDPPLPVDFSQHSIGITFPDGAPGFYEVGDTVTFELSSLSFTGAGDLVDDTLTVTVGGQTFGHFAVDSDATDNVDDTDGTASVSFVVPVGVANQSWVIEGNNTGVLFAEDSMTGVEIEETAPSVTTPPVTTPAGETTQDPAKLSATGLDPLPFGAAALLLFVFGAGGVVFARRRRAAATR